MSEWISEDDGLPIVNKIVQIHEKFYGFNLGIWDGERFLAIDPDSRRFDDCYSVVYWKELELSKFTE